MKEKAVVFGAAGMLSTALIPMLKKKFEVFEFNRETVDITDADKVTDLLQKILPRWIFNCAAFTKVDLCESKPEQAYAVNRDGAENIAKATSGVKGGKLVHLSTDFVFDGKKKEPYIESDLVAPQSVYGKSKAEGEKAVWNLLPNRSLIVRTSWVFGEGGPNFVETMLRLGKEKPKVNVVTDQVGRPTYTKDLAQALLNLVEVNALGWVHFANQGACSWNEFTHGIFELAGIETPIGNVTSAEFVRPAKRPCYSVLSTERYEKLTGKTIRPWKEALQEYLRSVHGSSISRS